MSYIVESSLFRKAQGEQIYFEPRCREGPQRALLGECPGTHIRQTPSITVHHSSPGPPASSPRCHPAESN